MPDVKHWQLSGSQDECDPVPLTGEQSYETMGKHR